MNRENRFFGLCSKISTVDAIFLPIVGMYKNNWVYTCNEYTTMCFSKFSTISTILWEGDELEWLTKTRILTVSTSTNLEGRRRMAIQAGFFSISMNSVGGEGIAVSIFIDKAKMQTSLCAILNKELRQTSYYTYQRRRWHKPVQVVACFRINPKALYFF